jgi:hypothetical protein
MLQIGMFCEVLRYSNIDLYIPYTTNLLKTLFFKKLFIKKITPCILDYRGLIRRYLNEKALVVQVLVVSNYLLY